MPCPLFLPDLPGCEAQPGVVVASEVIRLCCERGYAREACPHAAASEADAARFLIRAERSGTIEVAWSLERNHHPVATGTIAIDASGGAAQLSAGTPLERQAWALANEYLRRTGKP